MIKLTFELPDEVEQLIKGQGYDIPGYIEMRFVRPLMDGLKAQKRQKVLDAATAKINTEVEAIKVKFKSERRDFATLILSYGKDTDVDYREETVTVEVDQKTKQPINKLPKGAKIKEVVQ